jgi:hypothetical protein
MDKIINQAKEKIAINFNKIYTKFRIFGVRFAIKYTPNRIITLPF